MARDLSTGRFVKTEKALNKIGELIITEFRQYLIDNDKSVIQTELVLPTALFKQLMIKYYK